MKRIKKKQPSIGGAQLIYIVLAVIAAFSFGVTVGFHNKALSFQEDCAKPVQDAPTTSIISQEIQCPPVQQKSQLTQDLGFCRTSSTGYEVILESLLGMFFREADLLLGEGDVLDVGAQFGEQACHFAKLAPDRQVYAMDPSPSQVESIRTKFAAHLPNLNVIHAGIGAEVGTGVAGSGFTGMKEGDKFQVEIQMSSIQQ